MNVLPFVCAFILLFSFYGYQCLQNGINTIEENYHYHQSLRVSENYATKKQNAEFKTLLGKNTQTERKSTSSKQQISLYQSPRKKFHQSPQQKLNICELFQETYPPALREIALRLLKTLYQATSIYSNKMEEEILETIIQLCRENSSIDTFEKLLPKVPEKNLSYYYKLIRGTQNYQLKTNKGYPALGDFLCIDPKAHKKPIHFPLASEPILEAVFSPNISQQIINQEKAKWDVDHKNNPLTKQELETLFSKQRKNLSEYLSLLYFGKNQTPQTQEVVVLDDHFQIRIPQ